MKRKFVSNLILILTLNLLIKPFWIFGIDRTVQNITGAESYGTYFALLNISFLFNIFLDLGITNFNNRNIAQNNQLLNKHFSGIVVMKLFLAGLYLLITLLYVVLFSYTREQVFLLLLLCFNQFLASFILYLRSNISGLYMFRTDSMLSALDKLLMIIICGVLLWTDIGGGKFEITWFVYSQTAGYLITFFVAFIIVARKAEFKKVRWSVPFYLVVFKYSFPFALLVLLMNFYYRIDGIMLERILPDGSFYAGVYAAAFRLLDAGFMIAYLFSVLLLPIFSKMLKEKEKIDEMLKLSFSLIIIPAIIVAVCSFFYKKEIMGLLYHENVALSADVFGILMICFVAISGSYIISTLLTANGNLKQLNQIALLGVVVNILLNFLLIPHLKALGSAIASIVTQYVVFVLQILVAVKILNLKLNVKYILSLFSFVLIMALFAYISTFFDITWPYKVTGIVILAVFLAFLIKLLNVKALIKFIHNRHTLV